MISFVGDAGCRPLLVARRRVEILGTGCFGLLCLLIGVIFSNEGRGSLNLKKVKVRISRTEHEQNDVFMSIGIKLIVFILACSVKSIGVWFFFENNLRHAKLTYGPHICMY